MARIRNIMSADEINRAITRITHEILEKNKGAERLVLVGIKTGGAFLAARIQRQVEKIEGVHLPLGLLDITLYRDDLTEIGEQPNISETEIDFDVSRKRVVLIDDVLFTGRTIRCALDALIDFGRPESIQLAVLIDRGHRELPIKPDYVGKNIPTAKSELVQVTIGGEGTEDSVIVTEGESR